MASSIFTLRNLELAGVNISGAEYNTGNTGGQPGTDYIYPSHAEIDYFASKGFKMIRVPFDANRMQLQRLGPLNASELARLDSVINYATGKGLKVLLDPHNFGALNDNAGVLRVLGVDPLMPASFLADLWAKLAAHYLTQPNVMLGLMNEPHDQTAVEWHDVAISAINAIRSSGSRHKILIPGSARTSAWLWTSSGNAAAWDGFMDSNFAYEVHQYLDADASGTSPACAAGAGARLTDFTAWAESQQAQGFLAEVGWADSLGCAVEAQTLLMFMSSHSGVWLGYSYWSAGQWLGNNLFSIEPAGLGTAQIIDAAPMAILLSQ